MTKNKNTLDIIVPTKDLVHVLSFVSLVIDRKHIIQELSNVKLFAGAGILKIGATNNDLYLNQHIGVKVISEGEITISAQILSDVTRKISDTEIRLKQYVESNKLEIIASNCRFELLTLPVIQFPLMEDIDSHNSFKIPCIELLKIIEYTNFSISYEETRYNLNGLYLHIKDNKFSGVATDGHRLSIASFDITYKQQIDEFSSIVPRKSIAALLKIVKDTKYIHKDLKLILSDTKIKFICHNLVMVSKLVDATFPEYLSLIPRYNKYKLTISTKLFVEAIDRVATVTVDKFCAIKLLINCQEMKITAYGAAKGSASETIKFSKTNNKVGGFIGSEVNIGFNPKYISDVLNAITEDQVDIYLKDSLSPVLIKTTNGEFVIMPVKV